MSLILKLRGCANLKELTGELFVTSFGEILAPSTPDGKWAVELKKP